MRVIRRYYTFMKVRIRWIVSRQDGERMEKECLGGLSEHVIEGACT